MAKDKNMNEVSDKQMVEKVNKTLNDSEDSLFSRFVGIGLIIFGVLLVILAVSLVILSRRDPKVDESFSVPTIEAIRYSSDTLVTVSGESKDGGKIMLWINDELQQDLIDVTDGEYESEIDLVEEGDYKLAVAMIKGFVLKKRSVKSDTVTVTVDTTAPSSDVELNYDAVVESGVVTIQGKTKESGVTVILEGKRVYEVTSDKDGNFAFENISLAEGKNEFTVTLEDKAGNSKTLARKIVVDSTVADKGDLNGDGISEEIPEAAGELDDALNALFANKLMMFFGFAAIAVLAVNSVIVIKKARA